jgi:hypothetical protein
MISLAPPLAADGIHQLNNMVSSALLTGREQNIVILLASLLAADGSIN